ncbi:MAG: hypothetical protein KDL31_00195 [Kiritimatiellae bacterium]|nr:hypothetical protein [Kiritimatiellia bacterium]
MRLGPFDFDAKTGLEGIYTTNVDEVRPSEATAEMEDYYAIWSFDLFSTTAFNPNTKVQLDTGISIEKHANRPDLDNSESPFGRFLLRFDTDLNRFVVYGEVSYEKSSDSQTLDDIFIPEGYPRKGRRIGSTLDYLGGVDWSYDRYSAGASYEYSEERYDDEDYKDGEKDEATYSYYFSIDLLQNLAIGYEFEHKETAYINDTPPETIIEETQTINLDWDLQLVKRPRVTYTLAIENEEKSTTAPSDWQLTHTVRVEDDWNFAQNLAFGYYASYEYKQEYTADEIAFLYGATLDHQINALASQRFSAERQPVETFGSTDETDETTLSYLLEIKDIFIPDLKFSGGITHTISVPVDGPTERTWEYDVTFAHSRSLTRNLSRVLAYNYSLEQSNFYDEDLEVHEVSLSLVYTF